MYSEQFKRHLDEAITASPSPLDTQLALIQKENPWLYSAMVTNMKAINQDSGMDAATEYVGSACLAYFALSQAPEENGLKIVPISNPTLRSYVTEQLAHTAEGEEFLSFMTGRIKTAAPGFSDYMENSPAVGELNVFNLNGFGDVLIPMRMEITQLNN